mmetsp:Transcript_23202/g.43613  ORF Transcript_23202/g.43613 Transcript_23202/m.43613 type:complete len:160 (-) Transcript_23202:44-523(-)
MDRPSPPQTAASEPCMPDRKETAHEPRAPEGPKRSSLPSSLQALRTRKLTSARTSVSVDGMGDMPIEQPLQPAYHPSLQALLQAREQRQARRHTAALRWAKEEAMEKLASSYATCDIFDDSASLTQFQATCTELPRPDTQGKQENHFSEGQRPGEKVDR